MLPSPGYKMPYQLYQIYRASIPILNIDPKLNSGSHLHLHHIKVVKFCGNDACNAFLHLSEEGFHTHAICSTELEAQIGAFEGMSQFIQGTRGWRRCGWFERLGPSLWCECSHLHCRRWLHHWFILPNKSN